MTNNGKSPGPIIALLVALSGLQAAPIHAEPDANLIAQGRYLVQIAGCNDCHTPNYLLAEGRVPEALWLTGSSFGWRGPWGTTYATNLRNRLQELTQDEWLEYARNLHARPPMPWFMLNQMKTEDLTAIYQYVRHLGPAGTAAPAYLSPDIEPPPPFASFPSPPPQ